MKLTVQGIMRNRGLWSNALRSGDFQQQQGGLADFDYNAFCCLGVAEDVVGPTLPDECKISRIGEGTFGIINPDPDDDKYIIADTDLHTELRKALGLSNEQESILITLNDTCEVDFDGIAIVLSIMEIHLNGKVYDSFGFEEESHE